MSSFILLRFFSGLILLTIAAFQDLKSREIEDYTWKLLLSLSTIFLLLDSFLYGNILNLIKAPVLLIAAYILVYFLERFGIFQEGDSKLVLAIAFLFPELPNESTLFPAFFMSVFSNAIIVSLIFPFSFLFLNFIEILRGNFKISSFVDIIKMFSGYYKSGEKINSFEAVIEGNDLRSFLIKVNKAEMLNRKNLPAKERVFVTPAVPFAFLLLYGYLLSFFFGDLVALIV